jgi:protein TonB
MNSAIQFERLPPLDDPWRRLPWLIPAAIIAWAVLLFAFSSVLEQGPAPAPPENAVEARIVEIPAGGLAGGGGAGAAPAPVAKPLPHLAPKPHRVHPRKALKAPPPIPASPEGTLKSSSEAAPAGASSATAGPTAGGGSISAPGAATGSEGGGGSGGGIGTNTLGARALYAPTPEIPDDLRQDVFQAVAVAHFKVAYDGTVTVTLTTPTPNPRLNELLLTDLKQWRFFPGMKDGVAIDSEFDVRIPISVQ